MISRLVIFGASGDLTSRYLVPALARLWQAGQLPEDFCVTGVGRRDADSASFRQEMTEKLERFAAEVPPAARQAVCARLEYRRADSTNTRQVAVALAPLTGPFVAYLALPPRRVVTGHLPDERLQLRRKRWPYCRGVSLYLRLSPMLIVAIQRSRVQCSTEII